MSDFLDRLGDQLTATQSFSAVQSPPGANSFSGPRRRFRVRRRALLITGAVLAVAAPATALVAPWSPQLGRPGIDEPVHTDSSPVIRSATAVLAVLRRAQTGKDRELAAPLIGQVASANLVDGVQTDSIRMVGEGWALVPAKVVLDRRGGEVFPDQLCLTNGSTMSCQPADRVASRGIWVLAGATISGVVPDRVQRVRFTPEDGTATEADVRNNFFTLSSDQDRPTEAPTGGDPRSNAPASPPRPVNGTLQWLAADGHVVGPAEPRLMR
ncbi:MAG TPA: hypothetical protein VF257_11865 [Solirubrobacteraceae bacterium]